MELKELNKVHKGKYVHYYEATYINSEGAEKKYEIVSRNPNVSIEEFKSQEGKTDAVGIIAFNTSGNKILLQKEFRLATNQWVYNFPGGLIDKGETPEEAARRELFEETGLELKSIIDILPDAYTAVGISDEKVKTVICTADGKFAKSTETNEEIQPAWYSKYDIALLLKSSLMSLRTQSFLYMWMQS